MRLISGYQMTAKLKVTPWKPNNVKSSAGANIKAMKLFKVYTEAGVSAHKDEIESRPELMRLLGDVPRNQFDIVVVHTLDRWARKLKNQIHALDILAKE